MYQHYFFHKMQDGMKGKTKNHIVSEISKIQ